MLQELATHFREATPRIIPKWSQYLESLDFQKDQLKRRFLNVYGAESRAMRILRQMLIPVDTDIEYLKNQSNDFARYLNWFTKLEGTVTDIFDPVQGGRAYRKTFYKRGLFSTNEYLCPVDDVDHISILPFDKSWEEWEKVKPVTIWYHDTDEYSLNIVQGNVITKYTQPTYSVVFIDTISLLFKYYKYMTCDITGEHEKTPHNFLWKHVFSSFFDDLQNIWVLNRILYCASIIDNEENSKIILQQFPPSDKQYGYIGGRYLESMESLFEVFQDVKDGNLRVNNLLSSKLLPSGSILDRIHYSWKYLDVPHLQQYRHMRIIRDMPILDIILKMYAWRPDTEMYRTLRRDMLVHLRRYKSNRFWAKIADAAVRAKIEDWVLTTEESLGEE